MKRNIRGFTLLELTLYMVLGMGLWLGWNGLIIRWYSVIQQFDQKQRTISQLCVAHDWLVRDIMTIPYPAQWVKREKHTLLWQTSTGEVGWLFEKGCLYRLNSTFDKHRHEPTKIIAARNLGNFYWHQEGNGITTCLMSNPVVGAFESQRLVRMRNGPLS
jgi:hypothetical protein